MTTREGKPQEVVEPLPGGAAAVSLTPPGQDTGPAPDSTAGSVILADPYAAAFFDLEPAPYPEQPMPLEARLKDVAPAQWRKLAEEHDLVEADVDKLASWWHSDADLGREIECLNDMTKSRDLGFFGYRDTRASFLDLFTRLRAQRLIP